VTPGPPTAATLVEQLRPWVERLFPDTARAHRLNAHLHAAFGADRRPVDTHVAAEMERVAHRTSRHFALAVVPDGSLTPDVDPPGWPPVDPEVRRRGRFRA